MCAEHVKAWLADICYKEKVARENPCRIADTEEESLGKNWVFVKMIQTIWDQGEIPMQMSWIVVVLLPKGGNDFQGIGLLLDPCWKVVEKIMVRRTSTIDFHPCLQGGMPKRGTGMVTIEAKLAQQLAWVEQEPSYQIFVDLCKAYDHLNRAKCLEITTGYGVGSKLLRLQEKFWDQEEMVCRAGGSFGKPFATFRGITQGGPLSSIMFNVSVDAVIREWLHRTINEEAASWVFSEVCREIVVCFVDDGLVGSRDPVWLQSAMDVLVTHFEGIGLWTNPEKNNVMTCVPGNIQVAHTEEAYHVQQFGKSTPQQKVIGWSATSVGASLAAGSLCCHLETQHNTCWLFVLKRELTVEGEPWVYRAFADATGTYLCPVLACVGSTCAKAVLRSHFL